MLRPWNDLRIIIVAAFATLAIGLVGVGCGSSSDGTGSDTGSTGSTEVANEDGGSESVLTIAVANDVTGLDPAFVIDDQTHELVANNYDIGIGLGPTDTEFGEVMSSENPVPEAFEEWTKSPDGLKYTFKLREGMTFHDGSEVTADDVAYSYNRLLGTESGGKWAMENIVRTSKPVKTNGKYEVIMETDEPSTLATQMLFADTFAIVDKSEIEEHATKDDPWAEKWLAENLGNGSGPYKMTDRIPGQEIVMTAHEDYWKGPPAYDKVVVKVVPSASERVSLLKAGAVDMVTGLTPQQIQALEGTSGITISDGPTYRQTSIPLNTREGQLADLKLRQAMSYGVDYDEIIDSVFKGAAVRSVGPVPTGSPFALPVEDGYSHDPEKAKEILAESDYDGSAIKLTFNTEQGADEEIAVRIKSQMEKIGVKIELDPQSNAVFEEKQANAGFEMILNNILAWIPDPNYIMNLFYECENFFNYAGYCDESVDKAIEEGWGIFDFEERYELFEKAQTKLVEAAPWLWLAQANFQVAMKDSVTGFITPQNLIPIYNNLGPA